MRTLLAMLCVCSLTTIVVHGGAKEGKQATWHNAVTFEMPKEAFLKSRVTRGAEWLRRHSVQFVRHKDEDRISVIAWKDPTLEPTAPKHVAGYVITDTLWSAKALEVFDPVVSRELERSVQRLGWYGNGLHDVLFHRLDKILHCPADKDYVHGFPLGRFPAADGRTIDLRVFRQKWDADFDVGHPRLFAEHAVYRGLYDFWQGRERNARRRILETISDTRAADSKDSIFWDQNSGILVDYVTLEDWGGFCKGEKRVCRNYTFKLGVLLYGIRLLGMEREIGPQLADMKQRLWSAQKADGGVAHFVDVRIDGTATAGLHATGEASAIAILAETVEPQ